MDIKILADGVLEMMKARGLSALTIEAYRRAGLSQLIRWFDRTGDGKYDAETLEAFSQKYYDRFVGEEISKSHYFIVRRIAAYVKEYAEIGYVSFKHEAGIKKYVPSPKAFDTIESALATTKLNDKGRCYLDTPLRQFFCYIESRGFSEHDIDVQLIREYLLYVSPTNPGNLDKIVYSLKILTAYLVSIKAIELMPDFACFVPKTPSKKIIPAFSKEEIAKILSAIDTQTSIGKRNYAVILLACGTGFRGCDIINLKLADIDWKSGEINIIQSKTQKYMKVPVNGQIRNAIADYILNARPKSEVENVFLSTRPPFAALKSSVTFGYMIPALCRRTGVQQKQGRNFHSLRRSFGTWLAGEEVPITTISQMLGHVHMDSGKPYLSFNDTQMFACAMGFEDIPIGGGVYR